MPAEYLKTKKRLMEKGKSEKEAKRIAAIAYWKRHHVSVNEAHKKQFTHK